MAMDEHLVRGNRSPAADFRPPVSFAAELAAGPTFALAMTKRMLHQEWAMGVDEAIESEAQAQAICMMTQDFHRAYRAFAAKARLVFEGD
jgi:enoyl-CoA hydratase/carnithine racemase